jgi:hypothetical protein
MPTTTRTRHRRIADWLYAADVARLAGVTVQTIWRYNSVAEANREAGTPGPRDLPKAFREPNPRGGRPRLKWRGRDIEAWLEVRQGPGKPPADGSRPAPAGSKLGRAPRKPGPKPRTTART